MVDRRQPAQAALQRHLQPGDHVGGQAEIGGEQIAGTRRQHSHRGVGPHERGDHRQDGAVPSGDEDDPRARLDRGRRLAVPRLLGGRGVPLRLRP